MSLKSDVRKILLGHFHKKLAEEITDQILDLVKAHRKRPKRVAYNKGDLSVDPAEVRRRKELGLSVSEIARQLGCSRPTVYKALNQEDKKTKSSG